MAAASLNGLLRDRLIRHGVLLSRYENSLVNHVVGFLNDDVLPNLLARIQARLDAIKSRGFDLGPATTARLQAIAANIQDIIAGGRAELEARTMAGLVDLADQESQYSTNLLNTATPVNVTFDAPAPDLLAALVSEQPIGGTLLSGWFDSMEANTAAAVMRTIRSGIATGDTTDAIVRALRGTAANRYNDGVLQGTRRGVEALVRTATAHVANQAHMAVYKENSDLLNGVQWSSTLDARTCEECMDLDGTVYDDLNDGERPPAHISCRCAVLPVIKSYRQLGIPADELPESTRASMDGQVPESVTYGDWLADQPADVQDEALGPRRAELFRSGSIDIHGFVNDKGRLLTLDELKKAESG